MEGTVDEVTVVRCETLFSDQRGLMVRLSFGDRRPRSLIEREQWRGLLDRETRSFCDAHVAGSHGSIEESPTVIGPNLQAARVEVFVDTRHEFSRLLWLTWPARE